MQRHDLPPTHPLTEETDYIAESCSRQTNALPPRGAQESAPYIELSNKIHLNRPFPTPSPAIAPPLNGAFFYK